MDKMGMIIATLQYFIVAGIRWEYAQTPLAHGRCSVPFLKEFVKARQTFSQFSISDFLSLSIKINQQKQTQHRTKGTYDSIPVLGGKNV